MISVESCTRDLERRPAPGHPNQENEHLPRTGVLEYANIENENGYHYRPNPELGRVRRKGSQSLDRSWLNEPGPYPFLLLADPIGRLHCQYGLDSRSAPTRCHSFLIDPHGCLQFQLVHDLNDRGMKALVEVFEFSQQEQMTVTSHNPMETTHAANL